MQLLSVETPEVQELVDPKGDAADQVISNLEVARVRRLVRALPPIERRVVCWRFGLLGEPELPQREIARRLGISVDRAWRAEHHALMRLRTGLAPGQAEAEAA